MRTSIRILGLAAVLSLVPLVARAEGSSSVASCPAAAQASSPVASGPLMCNGTCTVTCESGTTHYLSTTEYRCCTVAARTCIYSNAEWWPGYGPECAGSVAMICP